MTDGEPVSAATAEAPWIERASFNTFRRLVRCALSEALLVGEFVPAGPHTRTRYRLQVPGVTADIVFREPVETWRTADAIRVEIAPAGMDAARSSCSPIDILTLLQCSDDAGSQTDRWSALLEEINNSVHNEALCLAHRHRQDRTIAEAASAAGAETLCDWVRTSMSTAESVRFFEQWSAIGHPHHPCSKTKLGFTTDDLIDYAPEFGSTFPVILAAIRNDCVNLRTTVTAEDVVAYFDRAFASAMTAWREGLRKHRLVPHDYTPIPVHPWQRRRIIPDAFSAELDAKSVVLIDDAVIPSQATLSLRTVCPVGDTMPPHLKLPIAVQATSAVREVKPELIMIGPTVTDIMAGICSADPDVGALLSVAGEQVAMNFVDKDTGPTARSTALAAILRTSFGHNLGPHDLAVPVAALFVPSPVTGLPLLIESLSQAAGSDADRFDALYREYVRRVIFVHMTLYLKYGIAFEAHQQNALVVLAADGRPTRLIARDFGNTRICADRADKFGWRFPDSVRDIVIMGREQVREMLVYTTLQSHIGDVITLVANHCRVSGDSLWAVVRQEIERLLTRHGGDLPPSVVEDDTRALLERPWRGKSLLRMRVVDAHDDQFVEIENPLLRGPSRQTETVDRRCA